MCDHEVRNIHCACQDADDLTHFAYITKDIKTQNHYCHVFRADQKVSKRKMLEKYPTDLSILFDGMQDLAAEIILTLGEAFEVAYQIVLNDQVVNQSDEEKIAHGHSRSKSEHVTETKDKFGHER